MSSVRDLPLTLSAITENNQVAFEIALDAQRFPFLLDHKVRGAVVVPGTAFLEMALAVGYELLRSSEFALNDVGFHQALFLPAAGARLMRCTVTQAISREYSFQIESCLIDGGVQQAPWIPHVTGRIVVSAPNAARTEVKLAQVLSRCTAAVSHDKHYSRFEKRGFEFGDSFRSMQEAWSGEDEAIGKVVVPNMLANERHKYYFHPALLDACLQVFAAALPASLDDVADTYLPVAVERYCLHQIPDEQVWSHVRMRRSSGGDPEQLVADVCIYAESGALVADVRGLCAQRLGRVAPCAVRDRVRRYLYETVWKEPAETLPSGSQSAIISSSNRWLLLADNGGAAQALAEFLIQNEQECHLLYAPSSGAKNKGSDAIRDMVSRNESGSGWRGVLHFWSLNAELNESRPANNLEELLYESCGSALQAIQALAQSASGRLWLITRNGQAFTRDEASAPMAGALWGMGRVIAQEQPARWGGMIDVEQSITTATLSTIWKILHNDTLRCGVVIRRERLYVPELKLLHADDAKENKIVLRENASYLITGGLGGVGHALALWLAKQGARHLTLLVHTPVTSMEVSRDGIPDARLRRLRELQAFGVQVNLEVGDVGDMALVRTLINKFGVTLPSLAGVIHAAGVIDDSVLTNLTMPSLTRVFAPKAWGAWNLHRCTADLHLDFFALCSSLAAQLGSPGQANYAAANALVDSLAQRRRAQGSAARAIDWAPWANVGLARDLDRQSLNDVGVHALTPEEACEAFSLALGAAPTSLLVANINWELFTASDAGRPWRAMVESMLAPEQESAHATPIVNPGIVDGFVSLTPGQRYARLLRVVKKEVAFVLGLKDAASLNDHEPLLNFGFESLMALRLKNNLEAELGCELPVTLVFDFPTISHITGHLLRRVMEGMDAEVAATPARVTDDLGIEDLSVILRELERLSGSHESMANTSATHMNIDNSRKSP